MNNIMLDLETMGNGPQAAIIAIGAVAFDPETKTLGPEFYRTVDLQSSVDCGGVMDPSTVMWWMQQGDEARAAFTRPGQHIIGALIDFKDYVQELPDPEKVKVWGNGAAFDNVILASAYRRQQMHPPWEFRNDRCFRTMRDLAPPDLDFKRIGTYHNALDDAKSQAVYLMDILEALR